jgi:hypothetical protein
MWGDRVPEEPSKIFDILQAPIVDPSLKHYYVRQFTDYGHAYPLKAMFGRFDVWKLPVSQMGSTPPGGPLPPNDASITQIALSAGEAGATRHQDTLEAGKIQIKGYRSENPVLFITTTNCNYADNGGNGSPDPGYCPSGFVTAQSTWFPMGWVQYANASWVPDQVINMDPTQGNAVMTFMWWYNVTHWELYVNNGLVGWFEPTCQGGVLQRWHPSDGTTAAGLRSFGTDSAWYMEVSKEYNGVSITDLGNGVYGAYTTPNGTYIGSWIDSMQVVRASDGAFIKYRCPPGGGACTGIPGTWLWNTYRTDPYCYNYSGWQGDRKYMGGPGAGGVWGGITCQ